MIPNLESAVSMAQIKHSKNVDRKVQYGTAGFRYRATDMEFIVYRMGLLATVRSCYKKAAVGLMITASHNPECDNGVKLVDPLGDMLEQAWEAHATALVNVSDAEIGDCLRTIMTSCGLTELATSAKNPVYIAMDTRKSSPSLAEAAMDGVKALEGHSVHFGELTTPQLHFLVHWCNTNDQKMPSEDMYYHKLAKPFIAIREQCATTKKNYEPLVVVDCANGIGAPKLKVLSSGHLGAALTCDIVNDGTKGGVLNLNCGADFVKVQQKIPHVQTGDVSVSAGRRCVSYDGDADRVVYFYLDNDNVFHLLDGDKIATLVASYLVGLMRRTGLELRIGLVQTAYANGSSTHYIQNSLNMPVTCAKTGVKHLHHAAKDYDVGVYFEANGHGTVLFSPAAVEKITEAPNKPGLSEEQRSDAKKLLNTMHVINQTVGDAISDMLLVETILHDYDWSVQDWDRVYTDLPNRQLKVSVADRTVIQTTDAERRTTSPAGLQDAIDTLVSAYPRGRAFTRPSGTEDVVRVYAESDTQANADSLALEVARVVHKLAGGVGDTPTKI